MRLRVRVRGMTLRMSVPASSSFACVLPRGPRRWQANLYPAHLNLLFTELAGRLTVDAPWKGVKAEHVRMELSGEEQMVETALEDFTTTAPAPRRPRPFEALVRQNEAGFRKFLAKLPEAPARFAEARELAGYILWSAVVAPSGNFLRPAMLMSKNHMCRVWSWDHCFNVLALAEGLPQLAWDQMMVLFDHQDADGALPDALDQESLTWNFCKPPIHGWTLRRLLRRSRAFDRELACFYPRLARWTEWWFRSRDDDRDGLPQYNHGNDSGWDNATCFDVGVPIEGPDLAAFLVLQLDALAEVAARLRKPRDAARWRARADALLRKMLKHFWRGDRFAAVQDGTHREPRKGDSLIPFVPLVLGRRLPGEIRRALVAGLVQPGRFLTEYGLATESPRSELYKPDGYWRGPIWAPSTMLICDGLLDAGETDLARTIAQRFCELCRKSGFAENFDALTGAPLCDKAYTWTAGVFLLLAEELGKG
jgi:glycogen debranching enzyme